MVNKFDFSVRMVLNKVILFRFHNFVFKRECSNWTLKIKSTENNDCLNGGILFLIFRNGRKRKEILFGLCNIIYLSESLIIASLSSSFSFYETQLSNEYTVNTAGTYGSF